MTRIAAGMGGRVSPRGNTSQHGAARVVEGPPQSTAGRDEIPQGRAGHRPRCLRASNTYCGKQYGNKWYWYPTA